MAPRGSHSTVPDGLQSHCACHAPQAAACRHDHPAPPVSRWPTGHDTHGPRLGSTGLPPLQRSSEGGRPCPPDQDVRPRGAAAGAFALPTAAPVLSFRTRAQRRGTPLPTGHPMATKAVAARRLPEHGGGAGCAGTRRSVAMLPQWCACARLSHPYMT